MIYRATESIMVVVNWSFVLSLRQGWLRCSVDTNGNHL